MKIFFLILFSLLVVFSPMKGLQAQEDIGFFTYHLAPPFIINAKTKEGLTYDLAEYFTERSQDRFNFIVTPLPRLRLDRNIKNTRNCVVPWVNPAWFKDKARTQYLWTDGFFKDSNSIISHIFNRINYEGPESLIGYAMAGLRGGRWVGLDRLIKEGKIQKLEVSDFEGAVKTVAGGRVDGAILPKSVADYFINTNEVSENIYFSPKNHNNYQRHMLVCQREDLQVFLQNETSKMVSSKQWKDILLKYNLLND